MAQGSRRMTNGRKRNDLAFVFSVTFVVK
jgi:hypothetical protein